MAAPLLFWDVDTQADFIYPDGKLYVAGAESIVPNVKTLTNWAASHRVPIISSACAHQPGDPEFAHYPPHCLAGTPGQRKIPETLLPGALTIPNRRVDLPEDSFRHPQIVIEKQQLDVFSNPNTEGLLHKLGAGYDIVLYGVVTEICVAFAARGIARRGYRVSLVTDAVRHLNESESAAFLQDFQKSGGTVTTAAELIRSQPE